MKKKLTPIHIINLFLFFITIIFLLGYILNFPKVNNYQQKGISIPAQIIKKSSHSIKSNSKYGSTEINQIQLKYNLNGISETIFVDEYIGKTEIDSYEIGQEVELVYLPDSFVVEKGKINFIQTPMLKTTIQNTINRLFWYPIFIGFSFLAYLLILLIQKFLFKSKKV